MCVFIRRLLGIATIIACNGLAFGQTDEGPFKLPGPPREPRVPSSPKVVYVSPPSLLDHIQYLESQNSILSQKISDCVRSHSELEAKYIELKTQLGEIGSTLPHASGLTQHPVTPTGTTAAPAKVRWNIAGMVHPSGETEKSVTDEGESNEATDVHAATTSPDAFMRGRLEKRHGATCTRLSTGSECAVVRPMSAAAQPFTQSLNSIEFSGAPLSRVMALETSQRLKDVLRPRADFKTLVGEVLRRVALTAFEKPIKLGSHGELGLRTADVVATVRNLQLNDTLLEVDFEVELPMAAIIGLGEAGSQTLEGAFVGRVSGILRVEPESAAPDTLNLKCGIKNLRVAMEKPDFPHLPLPDKIALDVPSLTLSLTATATTDDVTLTLVKIESSQWSVDDEPSMPALMRWLASAITELTPGEQIARSIIAPPHTTLHLANAGELFRSIYFERGARSVFAATLSFLVRQALVVNDQSHPSITEDPKKEFPITVDKLIPEIIKHPPITLWHPPITILVPDLSTFPPGVKTKVIKDGLMEIIKKAWEETISTISRVEIGNATLQSRLSSWRDPSTVVVDIQSVAYSAADGKLRIPFSVSSMEVLHYELQGTFVPAVLEGVDAATKSKTLVGDAVANTSGTGTVVVDDTFSVADLAMRIDQLKLGAVPDPSQWAAVAFGKEVPLPPLAAPEENGIRELTNLYLKKWGGDGELTKAAEKEAREKLAKWRDDDPKPEFVVLKENQDAGVALRNFLGGTLHDRLSQALKAPEAGTAGSGIVLKDQSKLKAAFDELDLLRGTAHAFRVSLAAPVDVSILVDPSLPSFLKALAGGDKVIDIGGDMTIQVALDLTDQLDAAKDVDLKLAAPQFDLKMSNVTINGRAFELPVALKVKDLKGSVHIARRDKSAILTGEFTDAGLVLGGVVDFPIKGVSISKALNEAMKDVTFDLSGLVLSPGK
jgi:hypothetical protein